MKTLADCLSRIDTIAEFPDNWDSYGAKKLSAETVNLTKQVLDKLNELNILPETINPSSEDTISLSFENELRKIYYVEIYKSGVIALWSSVSPYVETTLKEFATVFTEKFS